MLLMDAAKHPKKTPLKMLAAGPAPDRRLRGMRGVVRGPVPGRRRLGQLGPRPRRRASTVMILIMIPARLSPPSPPLPSRVRCADPGHMRNTLMYTLSSMESESESHRVRPYSCDSVQSARSNRMPLSARCPSTESIAGPCSKSFAMSNMPRFSASGAMHSTGLDSALGSREANSLASST